MPVVDGAAAVGAKGTAAVDVGVMGAIPPGAAPGVPGRGSSIAGAGLRVGPAMLELLICAAAGKPRPIAQLSNSAALSDFNFIVGLLAILLCPYISIEPKSMALLTNDAQYTAAANT